MNRRTFTGTAGGALAALALPSLPEPPTRRVATFYLDSESGLHRAGLDIAGLNLADETAGLLVLRLALDPGGQSTAQVGHHGPDWGHQYDPEVPITPADVAAILAEVADGDLAFIESKSVPKWLDPWEQPMTQEQQAAWERAMQWTPPARGVYGPKEPGDGREHWFDVWTSKGVCRQWHMSAGADAQSFIAHLWKQLNHMDPITAT